MKSKIYILLAFVPVAVFVSYYFSSISAPTQTTSASAPLPTKKNVPQEPISLLFIGDIMLDRTIRKDGELYGYKNLFSCLEEEFSTYDEVIGNLEGTITDFESTSKNAAYQSPESFRFTFDTEAVAALKDIGLSIVSIANNHIRDFGNEGIQQTVLHLDMLGLEFFGDPRLDGKTYVIKDIKGTSIAFIAYNEFLGTQEQTLLDLEKTKNISDVQIVFSHWGNEYVETHSNTKTLAHSFVDAGADLIIGAHPHVIQESEIYKEVPIYYSLGNFIFDQYWEESVRKGLGVHVEIQNKKITQREEVFFESTRHKGTCIKSPSHLEVRGAW